MGTLGTFDAFTAARLGIYAAQLGLKVTGNNVSNINTSGYTRQRIDQVSLRTGGNDRYAPPFAGHIGNGALVRGVNQIRDPYLDIRYRSTNADVGYHDTMLKGLNEIASILDEVGRGGNSEETYGDGLLYAQLQDMAEKLRSFSERPTNDNENLVRSSAAALTTLFNSYANRLEELRQDTETDFKNSVTDINDILINIRDLNKSIRQCELNGDKALELRDERNRQIDALSEYMDIRVIYSEEDIGAGLKVEKLSIHLDNANPDKKIETDSSLLVDGVYATQLSVPEKKPVINPDFDPTKYDPEDPTTEKYIYLYRTGEIDNTDPANPTVNYTGYTNDPTEAFLVDNDNYTIQLGKLLDSHEVEWKSSSSEPPVKLADGEDGSVVGKAAIYTTTLKLADGGDLPTAIKIGDEDVTIPSTVKDLNGLAKFLAGKLDAKNADYAVTSNGADIIFTAYQKGAIGGNGPAAAPTLTLTNGGDLSLDPMAETQKGVDSVPPTDPNAGTSIFDPITGEEIYYNYSEIGDSWYKITARIQHTREVALDDNDLHGKLQAQRELLTEEGNFASDNDVLIDENALTKRGIPYYQKSFDLLAQTLAEQYNKLNQGFAVNQNGNYIRADGSEILLAEADGSGPYAIDKYKGLTDGQAQNLINNGFFLKDADGNPVDESGKPLTDGSKVADLDSWLADENTGGVKMGGVLFSNSNGGDDPTGITAANIDISHSWMSGAVSLVPKYEILFGGDVSNSTQNINANHMVTMIDKALEYRPQDLNGSDAAGPLLFKGSFNDMFSNMMGIRGSDAHEITVKLTNDTTTLVELDSSRESVSGVDLNDEAMNMMQFQKAYSAACRLMTVIDEALDRLVNNTGAVGR